jgi:hypothetical protein
MKAKHFIIDYTVYPFDLLVSVCESDTTVRRVLKNKLPEDLHDQIDVVFKYSNACTVCFPNDATFIRFSVEPGQGLIAHEALHAVEFLMQNIGNEQVNEAWNYLLQYIVSQINKKLI